ncbi:MAG: O-antigen ligase family protein, partial [Patescibacteria group bacterium]
MTPKFILFQMLVEIVFAAWVALKVLHNPNKTQNPNNPNSEYLGKFVNSDYGKWLVRALFGFFGVSLLSAIFGIDFSRSFWGIGARMTGLFAELHFFAWFLVLASSLYNPNKLKNPNNPNSEYSDRFINSDYYLNFSFAISVLVAITGFFTVSDWRLVPGYTIFSNPTFVAPYFLFHFWWGLYQIYKSHNKFKLYFITSSILILASLFLGEIRGAIIGLLAGILFLGVGLMVSDIISRRKRIIIASFYTLLLLGVIFFWQWRDTPFIQSVGILKKFSETSISSATAQTRLLTWQSALEGFKDRPIFGAGPENFNYVFNAHYNPRILMFGGGGFAETWQDKPHNAFLEILTEVGLVGSLSYVLIWLAVAFALFKLFKSSLPAGRHGQKFLSFTLAAAFISYLGLMFFSFDSFGSWFGLYLMLGFLASQNNPNKEPNPNTPNSDYSDIIRKFGLLIGLAILLGLLYVNYSIWRSNLADADALRTFSRDPAQGVIFFKKSLSYFSPYKSEYRFDLIASVVGAVEKNFPIPNLEETINFMLEEADKAILAQPKDAAKYTDMARIYNILGAKGRNLEILAQAEMFGKKSLELSPQRQETMFYLARTALLKGDTRSAVDLSKQAVLAEPSIRQSHWYLGLAYIANNQRQEGVAEIKKALELGYKPQNTTEEVFIKNLGL